MAGRDVRADSSPSLAVGLFGFILASLLCLPGAPLWSQSKAIKVEGRDYQDLATAGARFGMGAYWLKGYETFRLRSQWTTVDFGKNTRAASINGVPVTLGFPTALSGDRLYFAESDHRHVLQPILTPQAFGKPPELRRIVLDPGHGGEDSGARNDAYGLKEKDLTLDVAQRLARLLRAAGYEVVLTRETDRFIPLEQRARIANYEKADLFLSIHFNAATNAQAAGYETFVLTPQYQPSSSASKPGKRDAERFRGNEQDPWNVLLGYHLQRSLVAGKVGPDRGLKRARFLVLKHLESPGALLELGFVSNPQSAQQIRQASHRERLAQSLFDGVRAYHQRLLRIR